jgi:hypothetical protein
MQIVFCDGNSLSYLNVNNCSALTVLYCNGSSLSNLDVSTCTALTNLDCNDNLLSSLNVSNLTKLVSLNCYNNSISVLDVSKCTKLTTLQCQYNSLSSLDVSKCTDLASLLCQNNSISRLDLSNCTGLSWLYSQNNRIPLSDLFVASEILKNNNASIGNIHLGYQTLQAKNVPLGVALFSDQSVFNGEYTKYEVEQNGSPAPASDYTVINGKITFNTLGDYTVIMRNDSIISSIAHRARASIDVSVKNTLNANANLSSLNVSAGFLNPFFSGTTYNYTVNVAHSVSSINITAALSDINASMLGDTGTHSLTVGTNTFTITVTAENGTTTQDYIVKVNRAANTDASLSSLTVSEGILTPAFSSATTNYTVDVPYSISSITITAALSDINASMLGDTGTRALVEGANNFTITITAEDGTTTSAYYVTVSRIASTDANLSNLTISDGSLTPAFSSTTYNYTVDVPYSISNITFTATLSDINASMIGDTGTRALVEGINTFSITVTAEDGATTETYTITVTRNAEIADASLASLTISMGSLSPAFSSTTYIYTVEVPYSIDSITIAAVTTSANAIMVGDTGTHSLIEGINTFTIIVTAEDGATTETYIITVTRNAEIVDASLASLTISAGSLTPAFNSLTYGYTVSLPNSVNYLTLTATASNPNATVAGDGQKPIVVGTTKFTITVTAANGTTTQDYTVTVTRADKVVGIADAVETDNYPSLHVYPNPTNGELRIENGKWGMENGELRMENVEIYDILGRMQNNYQFSIINSQLIIDISHLANGIYYLKIDGKTVKVIKN